MAISIFYTLSLLAFAIGTIPLYMTLIEMFPVYLLYYHYFVRKPINWIILCVLFSWTSLIYKINGQFPFWTIAPLLISFLALIIAYKFHQENAFKAVDYPQMENDISKLPISDEMQLAVLECDGVLKCYPLDYVIHHHVINDRFNTKTVALTYCAMCRSIIPFDVTDIGPLFVGSFKYSNMIVADRKTKTFFQQATFKSIIGKLHKSELKMIPFQILAWSDVLKLEPIPQVAKVTEKDFRDFQLPIHGIWKKIIATEHTPGSSAKHRDKSYPSRTHVIGVLDKMLKEKVVYLKKEVLSREVVVNKENNFFLIGKSNTVNGFKNTLKGSTLKISIEQNDLVDFKSQRRWNIRGTYKSGKIKEDLEPISLSDEYWYSWKKFHENSKLIRLIES